MAYLNPDYIIDKHVKSLYDRETNITANLVDLNDKHIERFVQSKGVAVDNIPTDDDDYATSTVVIDFARYDMAILLLEAFRGVAHGDTDDIYMDKIDTYKEELSKVKNEATRAAILSNTELERASFIGSVPVY